MPKSILDVKKVKQVKNKIEKENKLEIIVFLYDIVGKKMLIELWKTFILKSDRIKRKTITTN